jgi:HK97 family phage portal protein
MLRWLSNILQRAVGDNKGPFSFHDPRGWEVVGWTNGSDAGENVTAASALSLPAVWQAVGMISGDVSKIPLAVYRRRGEDREPDNAHPASRLIGLGNWANPLDDQRVSALILWRRLMTHALIWPRGFVWIDRNFQGQPIGLYNLMPDRTRVADLDGRLMVVTEVGGEIDVLPIEDCLIIENIGVNATEAFGPLMAARHNMGLQLAKRKFSSRFFANGLHAGGILQIPPGASDKARKKIEESIQNKAFSKDNAFKTMVLRDGFKWHQTMVDPAAAQMSEVEEQEVRNVARFYRMSPSRLGVKESISYNSEEAARRAYHDETLSYWLTAIKSECNLKLINETNRRSRFIDYKIQALLWADTATVISVGVQGVSSGIFNRDEVRRWFNMNAIPAGEGEKFLVPLNMGTAGDEPDEEPPNQPPPPPAADPSDDSEDPQDDDQQRGDVRSSIRTVIEQAICRSVRPCVAILDRSPDHRRGSAYLELYTKLDQMIGDVAALAESSGYSSGMLERIATEIQAYYHDNRESKSIDQIRDALTEHLPSAILDGDPEHASEN